VAVVVVVTALVGMLNETDAAPGATAAVAGGLAAGELLVRLTTAPPDGGRPFSEMMPDVGTPPVIGLDANSDLSDGG
jgi:hypothetical protein